MKKINQWVVLGLGVVLLACGDSHKPTSQLSDTGISHSPFLSNLLLSQNTFARGAGGGNVTVGVSFDFTDLDGDVKTVYILNPTGVIVTAANTGALKSGTWTGTFSLDTLSAGTFPGELYVKDSAGDESNHLLSSITITP